MSKRISFNITCDMEERWVPHFISMLKRMEYCGNIGHSELVGLYCDGDGDFHPRFDYSLDNIRYLRAPYEGSISVFDAG